MAAPHHHGHHHATTHNIYTGGGRVGKRFPSSRDDVLCVSLCLNVVFFLGLLYHSVVINNNITVNDIATTTKVVTAKAIVDKNTMILDSELRTSSSSSSVAAGDSSLRNRLVVGTEMTWHGGHPIEEKAGSCWCGANDRYCMCTPNLAIDLIIATPSHFTDGPSSTSSSGYDVWLVRRKDTSQLATMGGFVDVNETVEHAVRRELFEEFGIDLDSTKTAKALAAMSSRNQGNNNSNNDPSQYHQTPPSLLKLVGIYSDPRRDNRRRTASVVFAVHLDFDELHPKAGDDAKEVIKINFDDIEKHSFFSDHKTILLDYRNHLPTKKRNKKTAGGSVDLPNVVRTTCSSSYAVNAS